MPMKIEMLNFVPDELSWLDFNLSLNSIIRHSMRILNETLDNFAPSQESWERKMVKPTWFAWRLEHLISKRNQAHKQWLRGGKIESLHKFKDLRKRVQSWVRL